MGASTIVARLKSNNTVISSGYRGNAHNLSSTSLAGVAFTSGFAGRRDSATAMRNGYLLLVKISSNLWSCTGMIAGSDSVNTELICGTAEVADVDGFLVTTNNGTDLFDAGTINVSWEF